jgi:large subunit ribosomal protein L9
MKVILRKDVETLGKIGEVITVKDGYARNYLIPRSIAFAANESNVRALEEEKKQQSRKLDKEKKSSELLAGEMEKTSVTIKMKVGEDEKLFGSVTSQMIADALKEKGINLDKRQIELEDTLKSLGIFDVTVKLSGGVTGKVKVWIVRE